MSLSDRGSSEPDKPVHQPVLLREVIRGLDLQPGQTVVDGTVGAGGHSRKILEKIGPGGRLIGLDRDPMMLAHAAQVLDASNCILRHASYAQLPEILEPLGIAAVDRVLLDLGLSSDQLADAARGFGFTAGGPLDLRFDTSRGEPAWQYLERVNESQLADALEEFGEERFSHAIARHIIDARRHHPIRTAGDLVEAVAAAIPGKIQRESRKHPATRVFQALRIVVNDELGQLRTALDGAVHRCLAPGGRAVIITFHSLEDRLVKDAFREPQRWRNLTPKPVTASPAEQRINPRSRTAKLRAAERI